MPTTNQPTTSDREADLQRICDEVDPPSPLSAVPEDPGLIEDYAKEVARRYAPAVRCAEWEELRAGLARIESDWLFQPHESGEGYQFQDAGLFNITVTNGFLRRVLADLRHEKPRRG